MSDIKTLVMKLTINSTDFENGLKNAKSKMNQTEVFAIKAGASMKKAFGAVAVAIGGVTTVMEGFKKMMRSTEEGADSMDRSLHVAKTTTDKFFHSIATGSFESFLRGLSDITRNAKEAYDALDALGTMKMWGTAEISNLQAKIAEDKVIVNNKKSTEDERKAAQARIDTNIKEIENITGGILDKTQTSMKATLREIAGAGKMVSDEMLLSFKKMFQDETLGAEADKFFKEHSYQQLHTTYVGNAEGMPSYAQEYYTTEFDTEENRQIYEAMKNLATTNEENWKTYFDLMKEESALRSDLASQMAKANMLMNKESGGGSGGGKTTSTTPKSTGLTIEQWTEYYIRQMERVPLPLPQYQELGLPEENIIEEGTDELVESVTKRMAELVKQTAEAITMFSTLGNVFTQLGNISGDTVFGRISTGMGNIVSQATSTIQAMMALAKAETIEGIAEVFSKTPGLTFTKIAMTATALAGVLGIISSAKSSFAGSYAEGGVVPGNSYSGDKLWARVNSGELIVPYDKWHGNAMPERNDRTAASGLAQVLSVVGSAIERMKGVNESFAGSFSDGGIVGGNSYSGDQLLARVNSGELIIPYGDWHGGGREANVRFVIEGSQLKGVLDNYESIQNM